MSKQSNSEIIGLGAYLPDRRLTNNDLEKMVDTSDEWITRRTGVKERRISQKDEFASDMAIKAVEDLMRKNDVKIDDVDMIIVTTFTPDHFSPTVSALVQGHFDIHGAGTMDIAAGCTGFTYALCVADSLITAGNFKKILVIASETISKVVDYEDRNTCILFGDAAVAALLEESKGKGCFIASNFTSDGKLAENVYCSNLSDKINGTLVTKHRLFNQEGKFLYEYVLKNVPSGITSLLNKENLSLDDIDWFVPHSANLRMIEAICKKLGYPIEKTLISNDYYGNTSSASIPLAIYLGIDENKVKKGDKLLLYGFGGGLTHGGVVVEW